LSVSHLWLVIRSILHPKETTAILSLLSIISSAQAVLPKGIPLINSAKIMPV